MILQTTRFGEVDINEEQIIFFQNGIPGFTENKRYTLIPVPESSFYYLQSIESAELAFIVTDPFVFYPDYDFELAESVIKDLQIYSPQDVTVYSIVTVLNELEKATLNLLAPIVINNKSNHAKQFVLQGVAYQTKHPLFQPQKIK